jgi:hypothetical protein
MNHYENLLGYAPRNVPLRIAPIDSSRLVAPEVHFFGHKRSPIFRWLPARGKGVVDVRKRKSAPRETRLHHPKEMEMAKIRKSARKKWRSLRTEESRASDGCSSGRT